MEKNKLKEIIEGIFIAYEYDKRTHGLDEISVRILDRKIFYAIKQLNELEGIKNMCFKAYHKAKLRNLYLKIHNQQIYKH
ncbi:hypothetical protein VWJ19_05565 [Staphylococcus hominis]|uniref:hypothetical protein n=1 Tax=Staphylococcus hominis TaxID=1290 RepID=UPI002E16FA77|nr:hypothetical protein [Staphylococcus hominis]